MVHTKTATPVDKDVIVRRLYARGRWKLNSVAHFGGDETRIADMCLLRDVGVAPLFRPHLSLGWRGVFWLG